MSIKQTSTSKVPDRRVVRTRKAIRDAFVKMMFKDGYSSISATKIAAEANISRSTFYQHYTDCDALLSESIGGLFEDLASACLRHNGKVTIEQLCAHFWQGRHLTRDILTGQSGTKLTQLLADKFLANLIQDKANRRQAEGLAIFLAAGNIGVLLGWLTGRVQGNADEIAMLIHGASFCAANAPSQNDAV